MRFNFVYVLLGIMFLIPIVSALPPASAYSNPTMDGNGDPLANPKCLVTWNGCDDGDLVYKPGFCNFGVLIPDGIDQVHIQVNKANRYGGDLSMEFYESKDTNFLVWVDRERSPINVTCSVYNSVKDNYDLLDSDTLGVYGGYVDTNAVNTYTNIDKETVTSKWLLGLLLILVGFLVFFDAFFNDRFSRYI